MIHFVVPAESDFTLHEYLGHWGRDLTDRLRIMHTETLPSRCAFERGTYVLGALDQLTPGMLRFLGEMRTRLSGADGFRFLNDPARTLRRYDLLTELHRSERNAFRAVRATGDLGRLRFPVFLRSERSHTGAISGLLASASEVEPAIGDAIVRGYRAADLLVVEFCDTADAEGLYRKYAAFIVGRRVIARGLSLGREWMLKFNRSEFTRTMVLEELAYVRENPHAQQLAEIFDTARVEYGRIDYAIKDGRIQTWEINLHPTIGRGKRERSGKISLELEPIREQSKEHFYRTFREAWESVDIASNGRSAVSLTLDPGIVRAAASESASSRGKVLPAVRAALRPAKWMIEPVARPLLPLLGKLARRGLMR